MKSSSGRTGTQDPDATESGRGTGVEAGERAAAREAGIHRRWGSRLHPEDPAGTAVPPALGAPLGADRVELASGRGAEGDDDWDDTSEEPVMVVHSADEGAAVRERPDPCAAPGGRPADPGRSSSGPRMVAVLPRASAGNTLALLVGLLGLTAGGTALWLTALAQAEVEQIQASLAMPTGRSRATSAEGIEAARLAELRVALKRLHERVTALEAVTGRALGTAEPAVVPTESPTVRQGAAPVFDGVWRLEAPGSAGLPAVIPATELAAAWSEVRWPEVSFRPCALGHDGACGDGGEGGR